MDSQQNGRTSHSAIGRADGMRPELLDGAMCGGPSRPTASSAAVVPTVEGNAVAVVGPGGEIALSQSAVSRMELVIDSILDCFKISPEERAEISGNVPVAIGELWDSVVKAATIKSLLYVLYRMAYAHFAKIPRLRDSADDLAQEMVQKILARLVGVPHGNAGAWADALWTNAGVTYLRSVRSRRQKQRRDVPIEEYEQQTDELRGLVSDRIGAAPEWVQTIVNLIRDHETIESIAAKYGMKPKELRKMIQEEWPRPPRSRVPKKRRSSR